MSDRPVRPAPFHRVLRPAWVALAVASSSAAALASGWMFHGAGPERLTLEIPLAAPPQEIALGEAPGGERLVDVACTPGELPWTRQVLGHPLVREVRAETTPEGLRLSVVPGPRFGEIHAEPREGAPGLVIRFAAGSGPKAAPAEGGIEAIPVFAGPGPRPDESLDRGRGEARTIVIDPGHGGSEEGAVGPAGLVEKELTLDVARRLATLLRVEGFQVLLTRKGDDDVPLDARAAIANEHGADLFVSLHANASRHSGARGAETYFLSPDATDDEARTLAALENDAAAAATLDPSPASQRRPDDARPGGGELPLILWDLAQVGFLEESARLAETIQERFNRELDIADRGVRQAPFRVLVGATCPAVLVELGFLTNREEERLLASGAYRRRLASALAEAIKTFRAEPERDQRPASLGAAP